jgi:hypothetical protein
MNELFILILTHLYPVNLNINFFYVNLYDRNDQIIYLHTEQYKILMIKKGKEAIFF